MAGRDDRATWQLRQVGVVRSILQRRQDCPFQGTEGAPDAWLEIDPDYAEGLFTIEPGMELELLTWLHLARRDILKLHPRGNPANPLRGVFATRSPNRPNPIGLHRVTVLEIEGNRLRVEPLEVLDNTPVIDIKPVLKQKYPDFSR